MLRATITKFKRACALARMPRVLRGEFQIPPCNFDKISAIFMKSKSTTSGSKHEEDEKCKKCKQLLELAFGPEKTPPEEGFEKIEVAKIPELLAENGTQIAHNVTKTETICEKDNRITTGVTMSKQVDNDDYMPNIIKETKLGDEGKFEQKVEVIKEPPLFQSFKKDKGIHIDRSTHVLLSNKDSKKQPSGDVNMLEMLAKPTSDTIDKQVLNKIDKLGISQQLLKDITNNTFGNADGSTDKFKKDIQKPGKISEIDLETRVLEKDQTKMSKRNFINRRAIKHLALHMGAEDISKNITSRTNKSSEAKMKKGDKDATIKLTDDKHFKTEHKTPLDHEKLPESKKEKVKLQNVLTSKILTDDRRIRTDQEVPLDSRIRSQHNTLLNSEKLPENKREKDKLDIDSYNILTYDRYIRTSHEIPLDSGKSPEINKKKVESENVSTNILTDDRHFRANTINTSFDRETFPLIAREKVKLGNENIKTHKEPAIATDENDSNEPVVLVKECQDPGGFRITPETPKAQTLTDQLITLNLKIQEAMAAGQTSEVSELKEKEEILTKEAARQKLTNEITKLFKDDRMPRHLFANLTVVSKDIPKKPGAKKITEPAVFSKANPAKMVNDEKVPPHMFHDLTVLSRNLPKELKVIQNFFEQEHDPQLIKPDRLQYNSPNDDLVEDKDYSLELDPRVVIRENFVTKQPTHTEPHPPQNPNYYSNYFNNQGNMHPENMPPHNPYNMPPQNPFNTPPQNPYMPPQNPYNMPSQNPYGGPHMHFYNRTMANAVMPVNESPNEMLQVGIIADQIPTSYSALPQKPKKGEETQPNSELPRDNIDLPHDKMPHVTTTSTASVDQLIENISAANVNATSTVTQSNTVYHDNPKMTSSSNKSNQVDAGPSPKNLAVKSGGITKDLPTNNLPNKVIKMKGSTTDKKHGNIKDNLKRTIMPRLTPKTARVKVKSGSMKTPIKIKTDWRKSVSYSKAKPDMKPKKHYGVQTKSRVNPWITKGKVTIKPQKPAISAQGPEKIPMPAISPNMTLSEMLKNVRQRARLEMCQQIVMTAPAPKVKPTRGSCKKPKPPCPPPQKTCPSSEPKPCPPPQCPPKPPPAPKPCKPACPDPCATPKCPPAPKKDPCAKYEKTEGGTDIFGLVVSLGPMGMSKVSAVTLNELPEDGISNSLFMEEMFLCRNLPDSISLIKFEDPLVEAVNDLEDDISIPEILHKALIFPKNYEPWTPIPSWPIPRKVEKRKLVCPQEGCKVRGPPPPGAPCDTIHHPCAGFPNDKKRT